MLSRRHLLAAAGLGTATTLFPSAVPAFSAASRDPALEEYTWLTYAVNVEMTWGKLPFSGTAAEGQGRRFHHYEFWPWRNKDIDAILTINRELGLTPAQFSASPVKGFGHGITNPDLRGEPSLKRKSDPRFLWPRSWASRSSVWLPVRKRGLFPRRPNSGRHRCLEGGCQNRRTRRHHNYSRAAQCAGRSSPPVDRPLGRSRHGSEGRRIAQRQDALRRLSSADQRGKSHGQYSQISRPYWLFPDRRPSRSARAHDRRDQLPLCAPDHS